MNLSTIHFLKFLQFFQRLYLKFLLGLIQEFLQDLFQKFLQKINQWFIEGFLQKLNISKISSQISVLVEIYRSCIIFLEFLMVFFCQDSPKSSQLIYVPFWNHFVFGFIIYIWDETIHKRRNFIWRIPQKFLQGVLQRFLYKFLQKLIQTLIFSKMLLYYLLFAQETWLQYNGLINRCSAWFWKF